MKTTSGLCAADGLDHLQAILPGIKERLVRFSQADVVGRQITSYFSHLQVAYSRTPPGESWDRR